MKKLLKYLELPFQFDVQPLQRQLASLSGWQKHYQVKHYSGDWTAIPLRSPGGMENDIQVAPTDEAQYADTRVMEALPAAREILSGFQCELLAVRLLRLGGGASIHTHRDAELYFERGEARIHIPVITNPGVEFELAGEKLFLPEGSCWYMNFNLPHAIRNAGHTDRVHLVIDTRVNEWMEDIFRQPGLRKAETGENDEATERQIIESLRLLNTPESHRLADEREEALGK